MAGVTALPGASRRPEPGRVSKHSISGLEYHSWDQAFSRGSEEQECLKRVSEGKSDMFGAEATEETDGGRAGGASGQWAGGCGRDVLKFEPVRWQGWPCRAQRQGGCSGGHFQETTVTRPSGREMERRASSSQG